MSQPVRCVLPTQSLSGASPDILLELRLPAYDHTLSKSVEICFSLFHSGVSLILLLFNEDGTLPGLPIIGVDELKVGVANGDAKGLCWIEKGLGDIRFWMGRPPNPPLLKMDMDSAAAHRLLASST